MDSTGVEHKLQSCVWQVNSGSHLVPKPFSRQSTSQLLQLQNFNEFEMRASPGIPRVCEVRALEKREDAGKVLKIARDIKVEHGRTTFDFTICINLLFQGGSALAGTD